MANRILKAAPAKRTHYRLPEEARLEIIGRSDLAKSLQHIEAQRLQFMAAHGCDDFGQKINTPANN